MPQASFLKQLLTLPAIYNPQLSPDGRWVAFMWYRVHANVDVFLVPTDGSAEPVALTHTPEFTQLVSWTCDSRALIVSEDHDSDERERLFLIEIDRPGEMVPLTEDRPPYFLRGGQMTPDRTALVYAANYDFEHGQPSEATCVYRHDLATGERTAIARPQKPTYVLVELNRPGTQVLYCRKDRHPAGRQFWLVGVDGQDDREILNFGDDAKVIARWFPDGERILVLSESTGGPRQNYQSLGVYHVPSGEMRWLVDDPARSIESARVTGGGLVVVDEVRAARHVDSVIDPATGRETVFPSVPGNLLPLGQSPDGAWIGLYYSSASPAELVRFDLSAQSPADFTSLTRAWSRTTLTPGQLVPAESFTWASVDGLPIQGWLYRARPNAGRAILYVHGGPTAHSEDSVRPELQYYVSRGFNVLDVNYRGSTGFGLAFRESIKEDGWGGREQDDIRAGAEALIAAGLARPGQVSVTGTSYGGYSSWCQITHTPVEIIGAAAPICGMTDLVIDYHTTRPDLRPLSEEMIGGRPDQIPEKYFERSPINYVQNIRGRLLIVQGAVDPNVSPENVREVVNRLNEHGIAHQVLVFEDEGHGISKTVNQERLFPAIADFFEAPEPR